MTKHILLLAAVVGLGVSSVYAEDPNDPVPAPTSPVHSPNHHNKKHPKKTEKPPLAAAPQA
jgi:hypothetical protein